MTDWDDFNSHKELVKDFIAWLRDQGAVIVKLGDLDVTFAAPKAMPRDPGEEKLATFAMENRSALEMHASKRFGVTPDDIPLLGDA